MNPRNRASAPALILLALAPMLLLVLTGCIRWYGEEDAHTPPDPLAGTWVRQDDDPTFDGLELEVTLRRDGTYTAVIVSMSDAMAGLGFAVGGTKWDMVTPSGEEGVYWLRDHGFRDGQPVRRPMELRVNPDDPARLTLTPYIPASAADMVSQSDILAAAQVYARAG